MKARTMVIGVLIAISMLIGSASADPTIDIKTNTKSVQNGDTIYIPCGASAYSLVGLRSEYSGGWSIGDPYSVSIFEYGVGTIWTDPNIAGGLDSATYTSQITHAFSCDTTKSYKLIAEGTHYPNPRSEVFVRVTTDPVITPELPASVLTTVGLIGLIGMVILRRKN